MPTPNYAQREVEDTPASQEVVEDVKNPYQVPPPQAESSLQRAQEATQDQPHNPTAEALPEDGPPQYVPEQPQVAAPEPASTSNATPASDPSSVSVPTPMPTTQEAEVAREFLDALMNPSLPLERKKQLVLKYWKCAIN